MEQRNIEIEYVIQKYEQKDGRQKIKDELFLEDFRMKNKDGRQM